MQFGVHFRNSAAFQAQEKTISCQQLDSNNVKKAALRNSV